MARVITAIVTGIVLAMFLSACASRAPRVNCEGRLQPINLPAPAGDEDRAP
jgi:hypothetical protein